MSKRMEKIEIPETMTRSAFARHIGVKPSYITKLANNDRLILTADKKLVCVQASIQRIEDTRDLNRDDVAKRNAESRKNKGQEISSETDSDPETEKNPAVISFSESRARKEHYAALTAKASYEQMIGNLCEVSEVKAVVSEAGATLRVMLEQFPDHVAPGLAAETDENRVRSVLVDEIERVLNAVADKFSEMSERPGE